MQTTAQAKQIRMSARKIRIVANAVRGLRAADALVKLQFIQRAAALPLLKLLKSAMRNAEHNHAADPAVLKITALKIDDAGAIKRFRPRAMGRAAGIKKHMAHITLTLSD